MSAKVFLPFTAKTASDEARAVCEGCPVRQECYDDAVRDYHAGMKELGVRAGILFPWEYRALGKPPPRAEPVHRLTPAEAAMDPDERRRARWLETLKARLGMDASSPTDDDAS